MAATSGERFVALNPKLSGSKRGEWEVRNYSLRSFANISTNPDVAIVLRPDQVSQHAQVVKNLEPLFTEKARKNGTQGTVILKVVFSLNGRVIRIHVVQGVPDRLTENAVAAARGVPIHAGAEGWQANFHVRTLELTFGIFTRVM